MTTTYDHQEIENWATQKGHLVKTINQHVFDIGPFWYSKNCRVYKVETENKKVVWFRFQLLGTDIVEEDESKNKD